MGDIVHIGVCRLELHIPDSRSLKDRRQVARSLTVRIRNQFNVAVAEDSDTELQRRLTLFVCCVSNDAGYADRLSSQVAAFVQDLRPDLQMLDYQTEIISGV